ncbi:MAG: pro-sigmaK processing inhibitor BofA family protein [Desulfotomaculales bacterium]
MEGKFVLLGVIGLIGLFLFFTALLRTIKFLVRLAFTFALGGVLLFLANFLLDRWGLHVALNPVTIFAAGFLQIPGVILLALLGYFFL